MGSRYLYFKPVKYLQSLIPRNFIFINNLITSLNFDFLNIYILQGRKFV